MRGKGSFDCAGDCRRCSGFHKNSAALEREFEARFFLSLQSFSHENGSPLIENNDRTIEELKTCASDAIGPDTLALVEFKPSLRSLRRVVSFDDELHLPPAIGRQHRRRPAHLSPRREEPQKEPDADGYEERDEEQRHRPAPPSGKRSGCGNRRGSVAPAPAGLEHGSVEYSRRE